jgi:hypothetical protein
VIRRCIASDLVRIVDLDGDGHGDWSFPSDGPLPCSNDTFTFNTVQMPWRANCMALYGGNNISFTDNLCSDTANYPGLLLSTSFSANSTQGTIIAARNTLTRAGGPHYGQQYGALRFFADASPLQNIQVSDIEIDDPTFSGIQFDGSQLQSNITIDQVVVENPGTVGIFVTSVAQGGATLSNVAVTSGSNPGLQNDASGFTITQGTGNSGF